MAKFSRLVKGQQKSYTIDNEVSVSNSASSATVTFPVAIGNATYRVAAWLFNSTDANPQYIPLTITARSSASFTATWNNPVDSGNYKIMYIVPDGYIA